RLRRRGCGSCGLSLRRTVIGTRKVDRERRAVTDRGLHIDAAAERLDVTLDEREAKARTLDARAVRLGGAIELAEDARLLVRGDSRPVIAHRDRRGAGIGGGTHLDRAIRAAVL